MFSDSFPGNVALCQKTSRSFPVKNIPVNLYLSSVATVVAVGILALLSACGGGDTINNSYAMPAASSVSAPASAPVVSVPMKVGHMAMVGKDCPNKDSSFIWGEKATQLACIMFTSDADISIDSIPFSMYGNVNDARITRVYAMVDGKDVSGLMDFKAGKLVLVTDIQLLAGKEVTVQIMGDVPYPYQDLPQGAEIGFIVGDVKVGNLSPSTVSGVVASTNYTTPMKPFREVESVVLAQQYQNPDYIAGTGMILSSRAVNPSLTQVKISAANLYFSGNFDSDQVSAFVYNCMSNVRLTFGAGTAQETSVFFLARQISDQVKTSFTIPAGRGVDVSVSADMANCAVLNAGSTLDISLQFEVKYPGMTAPTTWTSPVKNTLKLPTNAKG